MQYVLLILILMMAAVFVFGGIGFSRMIAPRNPGGKKDEPYECGEKSIGPAWVQFNIGYYLFGLLFLVFDVESVFLYPWALVLRETGTQGLVAGILFVLVLGVALIYAWRKGALVWE